MAESCGERCLEPARICTPKEGSDNVCVCVCAEGDACSMTVRRGASIKLYLLGNAAVGAQVGGRAIFHELYREELCQHWRPIVHLHRAASVHDLWRSAGLCFSKINTRTHDECHC